MGGERDGGKEGERDRRKGQTSLVLSRRVRDQRLVAALQAEPVEWPVAIEVMSALLAQHKAAAAAAAERWGTDPSADVLMVEQPNLAKDYFPVRF